ncbi:hypothetical protein GQ42DRAFT_25776 [Ramicandelaber brevisporus]|nr:hypothetical protein GQ42DRAFT_25776 [Ramicandelaber brevisporus]
MVLSLLAHAIHAPAPTREKHGHPWPQPQAALLLAAFGALWLLVTDWPMRIRCLLGALGFSLTEFTFYTTTYETPEGGIVFAPFDPRCRKGHTTLQQFVCNVLYIPVVADLYFAIVPKSLIWRTLLWPINIWVLEVIQGYVMVYLYGYNPAWSYRGPFTYFHGNIRIGHGLFWIPMGLAVSLIYTFIME